MSKDFDDKNLQNRVENGINIGGDEASLVSILKKNDTTAFHMPGHKRNEKFEYLNGIEKLDFTEILGTDNLHNANGVLRNAMMFAAKTFSVKETRFLVNGSTCGIFAGIRATSKKNDVVLVARNCHKSVFNAIELLGLIPEYILPEYLDDCDFYGSVNPEKVDKLLNKTGAKLVVITSPTYEGVISDIKTIAEVCHRYDAILFVDEAHGAHLGFGGFEKSARELGADIVVNSLHKTLPSLTQTALLCVCTERIDTKRLDESLAMFETSSPSYVLMASIDSCLRYINSHPELIGNWVDNLNAIRDELSDLKKIKLFKADDNKVFAYDNSKLVFLTRNVNFSGVEFANILRDEFKLELEMASKNYAIAMTGAGDERASFDALKNAIQSIDDRAVFDVKKHDHLNSDIFKILPKRAFNPSEIDGLNVEYVKNCQLNGKVSAENIWAYPPGAPIIVKGERIDESVLKYLCDLQDAGVDVSSSLKNFPEGIVVLKER